MTPRRSAKWIVSAVIAISAGVGIWLYAAQPPRDPAVVLTHVSACMAATAETKYNYVIYLVEHKQSRPTSFADFGIKLPENAPDLKEITLRPTGFDALCSEDAASVTVQYTYGMNEKGKLGWTCAFPKGFEAGNLVACD